MSVCLSVCLMPATNSKMKNPKKPKTEGKAQIKNQHIHILHTIKNRQEASSVWPTYRNKRIVEKLKEQELSYRKQIARQLHKH